MRLGFDRKNNKFVELPNQKEIKNEFYNRIGEKFKMVWTRDEYGVIIPIYDTQDLPDGITKNNVKNTIKKMASAGYY